MNGLERQDESQHKPLQRTKSNGMMLTSIFRDRLICRVINKRTGTGQNSQKRINPINGLYTVHREYHLAMALCISAIISLTNVYSQQRDDGLEARIAWESRGAHIGRIKQCSNTSAELDLYHFQTESITEESFKNLPAPSFPFSVEIPCNKIWQLHYVHKYSNLVGLTIYSQDKSDLLDDHSVDIINKMHSLKCISLRKIQLPKFLDNINRFSGISLECCKFNNKYYQEIGNSKNLKELSISLSFDKDANFKISEVLKCKSLESLNISGGLYFDDTALVGLGKLTKLKSLRLSGFLKNNIFDQVACIEKLTYLKLDSPFIDDDISSKITKLQDLTVSHFSSTSVGDDVLIELLKLPKIKYIDVDNTRVTGAMVNSLRKVNKRIIIRYLAE